MILELCLVWTQADALQRAIGESRAGRFSEAWEIAQSAPTALERAQASTYVRYHAGDLAGALRCVEPGLDAAPADEYLLSTAAELALALRHASGAASYVARWKELGNSGRQADVARCEQELQQLLQAEQSAEAAARRAYWIGVAGVGLALCCLVLAAGTSGSRSLAVEP